MKVYLVMNYEEERDLSQTQRMRENHESNRLLLTPQLGHDLNQSIVPLAVPKCLVTARQKKLDSKSSYPVKVVSSATPPTFGK